MAPPSVLPWFCFAVPEVRQRWLFPLQIIDLKILNQMISLWQFLLETEKWGVLHLTWDGSNKEPLSLSGRVFVFSSQNLLLSLLGSWPSSGLCHWRFPSCKTWRQNSSYRNETRIFDKHELAWKLKMLMTWKRNFWVNLFAAKRPVRISRLLGIITCDFCVWSTVIQKRYFL